MTDQGSERPELLDNLGDETRHAAALEFLASDVGTNQRPVAVATGYVNLGGLHHLAMTVADGRGLRLLLGAAPDPALGAQLPLKRFELAIVALTTERDLARFPPSRAAARLAAIANWLDDPSVEVRRFVGQFLHGKAYLFGTAGDARAALITSANLTAAGLFANLELGLVRYEPSVARSAVQWFDALWGQATEFKDDLRDLLLPDPGMIDPDTVYLRALLELYGDELEADERPIADSSIELAPFQRHGFERARRIIAQQGGVVYADGVGTGKTEIGLAFIEEYALRRGQHALVIAPAQLGNVWRERITQARLPAQVITFQQLATDEQLAPDASNPRRHLYNDRDSYRLVVIDEAHAFRNADTTWYRALDRLMGGARKDIVLLTATPINNGLWDLYNLVMTFARHDRAFARLGITSLRELFVRAGAGERDPENLNPDLLFPIADAVSVRRDRSFIERTYPDATFPDGTPVRFPRPHLTTLRYDLDGAHMGLVELITGLIAELTMARYRPSAYQLGAEESVSERTLAGLLQSGILKRFESCWWACLNTVEKMLGVHEAFLAAWDQGFVPSREALVAAAAGELDDAGIATWIQEEVEGEAGTLPITDFRAEYRVDVAQDMQLLTQIRDALRENEPQHDPKLALLTQTLESSPSQKVAVFSTFGDTIRYLDEHLPELVGGRARVAVIGSETDPDTRSAALARFSPRTVVRGDYVPPDGEVDLLLSTDVLSEGQNLQQAAAVVSYDMPWNPQRVIQRNGRVIRLRSPHADVDLTTMLPEPGDLEDVLRLEVAIRRKVVAAGVYGMESEVIEGLESELRTFAGRLAAGDETLLDEGDGETDGRAFGLSGEGLRAELLRAFAEGEVDRLRSLPWGIGAAFSQGLGAASVGPPGIFFACRTSSGHRYWRYVEAQDGGVVTEDAEILRRINPSGANPVDLNEQSVDLESAWSIAIESIIAQHNERAAPPPGDESIGPNQRFALEVLRDPAVPLVAGAAEAEEALSVERSSAVRRELGAVRRAVSDGDLSRAQAAQRIVEIAQSFGLRAVEPPPQLDPIAEDDVGVVCWMVVQQAM